MRLEVRFGKRVFEIKMKKTDLLKTLHDTLPTIIGENAESMVLYKKSQKLDIFKSLQNNGLKNNDVIRMLPNNQVSVKCNANFKISF